jgi:hypothetical protein
MAMDPSECGEVNGMWNPAVGDCECMPDHHWVADPGHPYGGTCVPDDPNSGITYSTTIPVTVGLGGGTCADGETMIEIAGVSTCLTEEELIDYNIELDEDSDDDCQICNDDNTFCCGEGQCWNSDLQQCVDKIDGEAATQAGITISIVHAEQDGICGPSEAEYVAGEVGTSGVGAWYYEYSDVSAIICWEEELANQLDKGDLDAKELLDNLESYQEEIISMGSAPASPRRTFGASTVSPVNGKTMQTAKFSVTIPAGKKNVSLHIFKTIDLSLINQKFGTNFTDNRQVLSFSSQTIRSAGKNVTTATTGEISARKKGETSYAAGHVHSYKLDAQGNGMTFQACSPDGKCHSHKISNGVVHTSVGAHGAHIHSIAGKQGKKTSISNVLLKDNSSLRRLSNANVSLGPLPSSHLGSQTQEFSATRDLDGNASFIFDFDVSSALKHSPFGTIFSRNISSGARREIISSARIIFMEVIRKRIDIKPSVEEVIASSYQSTNSSLLNADSKLIRDRNNKDGKLLGSISELNMGSNNIRTFTGKDYSLPEEGKYEYTVKTVMTDGVVNYLNRKLRELTNAIKAAKGWSSDISSPTYSDTIRSSFSYKASRDIRKKYKYANTPIEKSLTVYSEIISDVFGISTASGVINVTYPMVNSVTGNSKGTSAVISAMESLEKRMKELLGSQLVSGQRSSEKFISSEAGKLPKGMLEFERSFNNQTLDMSDDIGTGYVYVDGPVNEFGVNLITKNGYNQRIENELGAFSSKKNVSVPSEIKETNVLSSALSSLSNFSTNMTSYLTPSSVAVGGEVFDLSTSNNKWNKSGASDIHDRLRNSGNKNASGDSSSLDLLRELGISCKILDNKTNTAGTFLVDDMESGGIFTEGDAFVDTNIVEDPFFDPTPLTAESEEVSKVLSTSLSTDQLKNTEVSTQAAFDVTADDNQFSTMSTSEIRDLPLQVKSLFLSRSEDIKHNLLDDNNSTEMMNINLNSLVGVEVLSYGVDLKGNAFPEWNILTPTRLRQVGNLSLRCRVKSYSNSDLGIGQEEDMLAPILNSDFIISGTNISSSRKTKRNQTPKQMERYLSKQNKIIRGQIGSLSSISTGRK